jgi:hypothetical protein
MHDVVSIAQQLGFILLGLIGLAPSRKSWESLGVD